MCKNIYTRGIRRKLSYTFLGFMGTFPFKALRVSRHSIGDVSSHLYKFSALEG